jgi:membrane protein required for colicin V production
MQTVDIGILIIITLPALVGVLYGFLNIVFSLLAWTLALGISIKFSFLFAPMLENSVEMPIVRNMLAFIGLFIVSLMILTSIGFLIVKLLGRTGLTGADRILGLFFGMGLGIVIATMIIFLLGFTSFPTEPWWEQSKIVTPFERVSVWSSKYLPENVSKYHGYEAPEEMLKEYSEDSDKEQELEKNDQEIGNHTEMKT